MVQSSLAAFDASHDYFAHSQFVWMAARRTLQGGQPLVLTNPVTGTTVTGPELLSLSQTYVSANLLSATFQEFVTLFEDFFFDLLGLWLTAFPASLGNRQLGFGTVLSAPNLEAVTAAVVGEELNKLKYQRVEEWFRYLERLVKLGVPTPDQVEAIAEIKASRDLLVHNKGVINWVYLSKAGPRARGREGELIVISESYHRRSWDLLRTVVRELADAAVLKA
jgi:hypothetical protein